MIEQWRPIPGFDGLYEISRHAEVRSWRMPGGKHAAGARAKEPRILTPNISRKKDNHRYLSISLLTEDGRRASFSVKRLMRDIWMGGPREGMVVRIIDGNHENCSLHNLEYATPAKGIQKFNDTQRRPVAKRSINHEIVAYYKSVREAADKNFITQSAMSKRIKRKIVADGFYFEFAR